MSARRKNTETGDIWLGRRCKICGSKLRGRQTSYCSEPCRKVAQAHYSREYHQREKAAGKARKKSAPPRLRIKKGTGTARRAPTQEQFSHYCQKFNLLITADICRRRQLMATSSGEMVDRFCRFTCRGEMLRPSTAAEREQHRREIERYARKLDLDASKVA